MSSPCREGIQEETTSHAANSTNSTRVCQGVYEGGCCFEGSALGRSWLVWSVAPSLPRLWEDTPARWLSSHSRSSTEPSPQTRPRCTPHLLTNTLTFPIPVIFPWSAVLWIRKHSCQCCVHLWFASKSPMLSRVIVKIHFQHHPQGSEGNSHRRRT